MGGRARAAIGAAVAGVAVGMAACGTTPPDPGEAGGGRTAPQPAPAPAEDVDLDSLTLDVRCWYSLVASSPEQDAGLVATYTDWEAADAGDLPEEVELPHDDWEVEVRLGRDLFFKWCDDTVERGDPQPDVTERWPVVAGTITLHGPVPEPGCGLPGELAASLSGLVAERTDGTAVELGDIDLTNDAWGCIPG